MQRAIRHAGFVERQLDTGEVALNYVEGPDAGMPLVLMPGQTMSWHSYTKVLPALARHFHVFAVDVRGHGRSSWTPGAYTFGAMAGDIAALVRDRVGRPAILSGNSSGGVIAVGVAGVAPAWVRGIVPEVPPLFSCEYPRIRDCYAWHLLSAAVRHVGGPAPRDIVGFFSDFEVPIQGGQRVMRFPPFAVQLVRLIVWLHERCRPGRPVDLPLVPLPIRLFVKGLSEYDPDFSRAFLSAAAHRDFVHETALEQVRCPMLLLHADWFMHPRFGLVGAMNDDDVARVRRLVPTMDYRRIHGAHMLHVDRPREFVQALVEFAARLPAAPSQ